MSNLNKQRREEVKSLIDRLTDYRDKCKFDDRQIICDAIKALEHFSQNKKYGLVWEDHEEDTENLNKKNIPVYREDCKRRIVSLPTELFNFILEGDNLQSLHLLLKTHREKVDVIYIDPPYNTGNNDFVYNDNFVDLNDNFRHSKWISFMYKRLLIARELLSDNGLIFISIDDNELAPLRMIMDEIFGKNLFINTFVWKRNSSVKTEKRKFTQNTEYVILYAKSENYTLNSVFAPLTPSTLEMYKYDDGDGRGIYRTTPLQKPNNPTPGTKYEYKDNDGKIWKCPTKGWAMTYAKMKALENDGRLSLTGRTLRRKSYWKERENEGRRIDSLWNDLPENSVGTSELASVLGENNAFNNPKPVDLIRRCIEIANKNALVLDFFAGSGTTAQAVLKSNANDGGKRRFILCTNNEISEDKKINYFINKGYIQAAPNKDAPSYEKWVSDWKSFKSSNEYLSEISTDEYKSMGICRRVTYPRIRNIVSLDYDDHENKISKENQKNWKFPANVKYFECQWIPRNPENYSLSNSLLKHTREMIEIQNGINIDDDANDSHLLILNKRDFNVGFNRTIKQSQEIKVWANMNVSFDSLQLKKLKDVGCVWVPNEFFGSELKEAGE